MSYQFQECDDPLNFFDVCDRPPPPTSNRCSKKKSRPKACEKRSLSTPRCPPSTPRCPTASSKRPRDRSQRPVPCSPPAANPRRSQSPDNNSVLSWMMNIATCFYKWTAGFFACPPPDGRDAPCGPRQLSRKTKASPSKRNVRCGTNTLPKSDGVMCGPSREEIMELVRTTNTLKCQVSLLLETIARESRKNKRKQAEACHVTRPSCHAPTVSNQPSCGAPSVNIFTTDVSSVDSDLPGFRPCPPRPSPTRPCPPKQSPPRRKSSRRDERERSKTRQEQDDDDDSYVCTKSKQVSEAIKLLLEAVKD